MYRRTEYNPVEQCNLFTPPCKIFLFLAAPTPCGMSSNYAILRYTFEMECFRSMYTIQRVWFEQKQ